MADIVLSNQLYIVYDSQTIACTTSFNLTVEKAGINVNCMGGSWQRNLGGGKNWSIEFDSVVKRNDPGGNLKYVDLMNRLINTNEIVTCGLPSTVLTDRYQQGQAQLISLNKTGSTDESVTYSGVLQGYGLLFIIQPGAQNNIPKIIPHIIP